jgi:hypothetical protein
MTGANIENTTGAIETEMPGTGQLVEGAVFLRQLNGGAGFNIHHFRQLNEGAGFFKQLIEGAGFFIKHFLEMSETGTYLPDDFLPDDVLHGTELTPG